MIETFGTFYENFLFTFGGKPKYSALTHDAGLNTHAEIHGDDAVIVAHSHNHEGDWEDTHGNANFTKNLMGKWETDHYEAESPEAHAAMAKHAKAIGINSTIPSFKPPYDIDSDPQFASESFVGLSNISAAKPDDFKIVNKRREPNYSHDTYRFKSKDGDDRYLHVSTFGQDPTESHQMSFSIQPSERLDPMSPEAEAKMEAHGRVADVMSAVAHHLHGHIERNKPQSVGWMATSRSRNRMYGAVYSKAKPNGYYMKLWNVAPLHGGSIEKFPKF